MEIPALRAELNSTSAESYVDSKILGVVPWIFASDAEAFKSWEQRLSKETGLELGSIFVVGSAATGFSLSPRKPGRAFRTLSVTNSDRSDIDLAIASEDLFIAAWITVLNIDRSVKSAKPDDYNEKMREGIYWGHVSEKVIPRGTEVSRRLMVLKASCTRELPFMGYSVSSRLYRRRLDLRGYQVWSIRKLRSALNTTGVGHEN